MNTDKSGFFFARHSCGSGALNSQRAGHPAPFVFRDEEKKVKDTGFPLSRE
jgi:hypothetical protein